jgi:hypothetical protein
MPRLVALRLAAVLALATQTAAVALERPDAQADTAWLIVVDDLHLNFVQTGRLRDLLRAVASALVHDGDLYELLATGPSKSTPQTTNRDLLAPAISAMTGNGLKAVDTLGAVSGSPALNEMLYRATVALDTAYDALVAFAAGDGRRKAIVYISGGYDIDAFPALSDRVSAFARRAREDGVTIFAIDPGSLLPLPPLDPIVDPATWLRHTAATRRSLTMMTEPAGGFVIEKSSQRDTDLKRINMQMR